jgi:hypothetical protein
VDSEPIPGQRVRAISGSVPEGPSAGPNSTLERVRFRGIQFGNDAVSHFRSVRAAPEKLVIFGRVEIEYSVSEARDARTGHNVRTERTR